VLSVELQLFTVLKLNVIEPFFSFSNVNEQAVQFNIRFSQGNAAKYFRCVGRSYTTFIYTSSENATVKELLTSVHICKSYEV